MKQSQQLREIKSHVEKFIEVDKKLKLMRVELNQMPLGSYPHFADRMDLLIEKKEMIALATMYMLAEYFGE